jgi:hypothetical protein
MSVVTSSQIHTLVEILSKEFDVGHKFIISSIRKSIQKMRDDHNIPNSNVANNSKPSIKEESKLCSYTYQRGTKKDVKCNLPCKQDSSFCSRHCKKTDDKKKDKVINKKVETIKVINKLMKIKPTLEINRNKFGNFETPNNLVYDINSKEIIGFQNTNGSIRDLIKTEIEWCKDNNLKFKLPFNLNIEQNNTLKLPAENTLELEEEFNEDYEEQEEDEYEDIE